MVGFCIKWFLEGGNNFCKMFLGWVIINRFKSGILKHFISIWISIFMFYFYLNEFLIKKIYSTINIGIGIFLKNALFIKRVKSSSAHKVTKRMLMKSYIGLICGVYVYTQYLSLYISNIIF